MSICSSTAGPVSDESIHQIVRYDNLITLAASLRKSLDLEAMCAQLLKSWPMITGIPLIAFALYHENDAQIDLFCNRTLTKNVETPDVQSSLLALETAGKFHNRDAPHPLLSLLYPEQNSITAEIYPRELKSVNLRFIYSFATSETGFVRLEHKFAQLAFNNFEQALLTHYQEHLLALQKEREAYLARVLVLNEELVKAEKIALDEADKANRANMAKTEFLSNMSHELRTPMHAVINYAKMGLTRFGKEEPAKMEKYFSNIGIAGNRLMGLLNNLLDLAKLEAGKMTFTFEPFCLAQIIDNALIEIGILAENKNIQIKIERLSQDLTTFCDKHRLVQVMVNLLSNAIKFAPADSNIHILLSSTTHNNQPVLRCEIDDEGEGIPESELEAVFDKFIQSSKTKTGAGGTGLGLSICREIIHAHQGLIWAENRHPKGAKFTFVIAKQEITANSDVLKEHT